MSNLKDALHIPDTQSERDERHLAIQRVGIKDVRYPMALRLGHAVLHTVAQWDLDVALPAEQKGTHMSRFVAWLDALSEPLDASLLRTAMAAMLDKLHADSGRIEARFPFFLRKRAPVSGVESLLEYQGKWIVETSAAGTAVWAEVVVPVKSLCPCSKEISDYGAHNQRSHVTVRVELLNELPWTELVRFAEDSASCEIWPMLKRADEKWVHRTRLRKPQVRRRPGARRGAAAECRCTGRPLQRGCGELRVHPRTFGLRPHRTLLRPRAALTNIHTPQVRRAGRDWLSLALMDARNHSLRWSSVFEAALASDPALWPNPPEINPPLWELGHIGWFQEAWIARNVQRHRGTACDPTAPRLASIEPHADRWYDPDGVPPGDRWKIALPSLQATKQYLADTMEITLDLLSSADPGDAALYFYRMALFHEDLRGEALAVAAQTLGLSLGDTEGSAAALRLAWRTQAPREPLFFPATRWSLGSVDAGFVFDNELMPHEVRVPEFEIDAQAVTWAQYSEFVEDGGYDEATWWSATGWDWVRSQGRRTPRHVEQMRQAVLQQRFGRTTRVPMTQPVVHVSAHEAEAWCRWAGRRLPSEVEWEVAAHQGASRGFRWGEVWEWSASSFRPYPGFEAHPWRGCSEPWFNSHRVLRGASVATPGRLRDPKFRHFALPERDELFSGFRSCAV